jgi:thiol-disulfide isomerase/thioredoxin
MSFLVRIHRIVAASLLLLLAPGAPPAAAASLEPFAPEAYRGKVLLLDFWASWCAPCKESFPWMQQMAARYGARGLAVVAVNVDHDRALAEKFLRAQQPAFDIVFDPLGRLAERYQVETMPSSFYIDRGGKVRQVHRGFRAQERGDAEREIARLLEER